ncbi:MAG: leucine dehydrogenase [Parcubacteria group bacterium Greene0714_36]|nr:MAG: leucine dehydrogenase [Parcubacteria group bacterium Greene0714_36]
MNRLTIEKLPQFDGHEMVSCFHDKATGLRGFIGIHNTRLGPATGGTRYWRYDSEREALGDVLNLSRAMTYKCALAGVPYGGGKAVIMRNARYPKNAAFFAAYGRLVNLFNGKFYTGEDVGMTEQDVAILARYSPFINGLPGKAGDPAPWAALSVFYAMEAGLKAVFGAATMRGKTFAIKGLGKVGGELVRLITERGGTVYGADVKREAVKNAVRRFPNMKIVRPADIHALKVNVFSPCAMGGDFSGRTVPRLKCDIVCGGANNQLMSAQDGERLHERGILYIPDYVANAGGLINVSEEWNKKGYDRDEVMKKVKAVGKTVRRIIERARKQRAPTSMIADRLAEKVFNGKSKYENTYA